MSEKIRQNLVNPYAMNNPFAKKLASSAARYNTLSKVFTNFVNNRKDSDVQFKVVESYKTKENGETIYNESTATTLYAHSTILRWRSRYFATMLDEDKSRKENPNGVIYISDISPITFEDILHYIYTGNIRAIQGVGLINLIIAANKMNLEELSIGSQAKIIRTIKYAFSDRSDNNNENEIEETFEEPIYFFSTKEVVSMYIIPVLNISNTHNLSSHFFPELFKILLPHMSVISTIPAVYTEFVNSISSEGLLRVISSDYLGLEESSVWDLILSWACHELNISKAAVETRLKSISTPEHNKNEGTSVNNVKETISLSQLSHLKEVISPFLTAVRFGLLEAKDYARIVYMVNYFLPYCRSVELQELFLDPSQKRKLEVPRMTAKYLSSSIIITESTAWELLRKNIFDTGAIAGCYSLNHLKFKLLFRASEHGFLAHTFHQRCDKKGPTLTLVRSEDGHLFGGVNFIDWNSSGLYAISRQNFLFTLPDGHHQKNSVIFRVGGNIYNSQLSNDFSAGPIFGTGDLCIANAANTNQNSYSRLPKAYIGPPEITLAGSSQFQVSDYEVFAISK